MPLQPPLPSQPRPPSMPPYPHQNYSHMGPNAGYQHPGAPQLHHSQPMFHRIRVTISSENTELKLQLQAIEQQDQVRDLAYYSYFPSKVEGLSATSIKDWIRCSLFVGLSSAIYLSILVFTVMVLKYAA